MVSDVACPSEHGSHDQVDAQMEQQGEPAQIDADGHVDGHGEGAGDTQVEAPGVGPGDSDGPDVHHGDGHADGHAGADDYRALTAHSAEVQHDGEDARRHEADGDGPGQEAPDMTDIADGSDVGQHDVEAPVEHPSSSQAPDDGVDDKVRGLNFFAVEIWPEATLCSNFSFRIHSC